MSNPNYWVVMQTYEGAVTGCWGGPLLVGRFKPQLHHTDAEMPPFAIFRTEGNQIYFQVTEKRIDMYTDAETKVSRALTFPWSQQRTEVDCDRFSYTIFLLGDAEILGEDGPA